ncbi:MAG: insulinase family protein [Chloroflexi bacterium]|nr:insulinase family protein [Chloroflexota bacterium]
MSSSGNGAGAHFYTHRQANGLHLLGQMMPSVESVSACFYVNTGSRDEPAELMGVSHFLEHMMFKGTPTRDYKAINRAFEEMGAENNAGTWLEFTYYWAKVLGDQTPALIDLLADMMRPKLAREDFDQERNVILEEIKRYEDMPSFKLFEHLLQDYYGAYPLSHLVLGTVDTIGGLDLEAMRAYHRRRYAPNNIIFAIAGKFDWDAVARQVETLTADWEPGDGGRATADIRPAPKRRVYHRPDLQQQLLTIAMPSVGRSDPDRYTAEVMATVLGDDTGSRLFWGIREAGLAESAAAEVLSFDGVGMTLAMATTTPQLAPACYAALQRELARMQRDGVDAAELARAKTKLASSVVMDGESTNRRMLALVDSWLSLGRLETLEDVVAKVEAVGVDDIRALLDRLPLTDPQVVAAMGPLDEAGLFGSS